jgi:SAM-dependent MidA family methyltransferase
VEFTRSIGGDFPEGYCTEFCPGIEPWITEASGLFERGLWWVIDYGHEQEAYYHPDRSSGTLRCYHQHRAGDDPFLHPGEQDITAHVDFTRLGHLAEKAGLTLERYRDQHHFLIDSARPWLLSVEGNAPDARLAKRLRQFQTLTHPSMMGQQFKVMELSRGLPGQEG